VGEVFVRLRRGRWPLSKGLLVEALLPLGIPLEAAQAVAHTVEERLKAKGRSEVSPKTLRQVFLEEVAGALGQEVADRLARQTLPFEEIQVVEGKKKRPFSKGLLARSLEEAGLSLKEAHQLAKEVERRLREEGVRTISARRLEALVAQELERLKGKAAKRRYLQRQAFAGELFVEEESGEPRMPFSKGILAQSLMGIGLSPEKAYRLARELEALLHREGRRVIRRTELRERVYQALLKEAGEEMARRYLLLRRLRRSARPVHILIGGVTGVGKSVLASALAYRLGITHIVPSDAVREVFRATLSKDLLPTLHQSTFEAWKALLPEISLEEESHEERVMRGFLDQVMKVAVGLRAIQERSALEGTSIVLEGSTWCPATWSTPTRTGSSPCPCWWSSRTRSSTGTASSFGTGRRATPGRRRSTWPTSPRSASSRTTSSSGPRRRASPPSRGRTWTRRWRRPSRSWWPTWRRRRRPVLEALAFPSSWPWLSA
jgi:2-phosphoglycerate kinase